MHKYTIKHLKREKIICFITSLILWLIVPFNEIINKGLMLIKINYTISDTIISRLSIGGSIYFFIIYEFLFCRYLWKIKPLKLFFKIPDLNGNWKIEGESQNKDQNKYYKWEGNLKIIQTFKTISIVLSTANSDSKSESKSHTADLSINSTGNYMLEYSYLNIPKNNAPEDMRTHKGNCTITFGKNENIGEGEYFNNNRDRATNGIMKLTKELKCNG